MMLAQHRPVFLQHQLVRRHERRRLVWRAVVIAIVVAGAIAWGWR